ncbi:MAG: D-alanine--D-alanine ligase, partial [Clostridiales bacterium]|nr:D-alanine--D-alanine ligase [Clostridiales bacterium]
MKIVVLAGGLSPERDVSMSSGSLIANALMENGHSVCLLDLFTGTGGTPEKLFIDKISIKMYSYIIPAKEPDLDAMVTIFGNQQIGKNVINTCNAADLVFIALHGGIGENGKLQAVFDTFNIKYTGTGYIGSALAMDKDLSKQLMVQNQILTPQWLIENTQSENFIQTVETLGFPCVIKPCSCGSSIGVSLVKNIDELIPAITSVKKYENTILIEKCISGREFSVGILGGEALPVIEINPGEGFYDYRNKYQAGLTKEICPAPISDELTCKIKEIALKVHKILRLGSYSRIDFIMDENEDFYCLEANTLPGMTPTSLLPQEALAMGI